MTGSGDNLKGDAAEVDAVSDRPPASDRDRCPCHILVGAEIEVFGSAEQAVLAKAGAQERKIGDGDLLKAMEIAGVVEVKMGRHGDYGEGRQALRHRCDVAQARTGV